MSNIEHLAHELVELSKKAKESYQRGDMTHSKHLLKKLIKMNIEEFRLLPHESSYASMLKELKQIVIQSKRALKDFDIHHNDARQVIERILLLETQFLIDVEKHEERSAHELFYVGVDGGGTKTKCVVANRAGHIVASGHSASSNPNYKGLYFALQSVVNSIKDALSKIRRDIHDVSFDRVCVGLSGAGPVNRPRFRDALAKYFDSLNIKYHDVKVYSDAFIAWHGAFGGADGIIVISGTGGFVFGRFGGHEINSNHLNRKNVTLRGGGFHIGIYAAKHLFELLDHNKKSDFLSLIGESFNNGSLWHEFRGRKDLKELLKDVTRCTKGQPMHILSREHVAALARFVDIAASRGSFEAKKLLVKSANQLSSDVDMIAHMFKMDDKHFRVAVIGSVMNSAYVSTQLKKQLGIVQPEAEVLKPHMPPEEGALDIALKNFYQ